MLVVILGAGASYDSNLDVPVSFKDSLAFDFVDDLTEVTRPPLAPQLFEMDRRVHHEAAMAFPRAAPALLDARADVRAGLSIEAALQRLQDEFDDDPDVRAQLLSLRYYLQRVLTRTPRAWDEAAHGQTSYVSLLSQLARWARKVGEQLCLITFNYDDMLERAIERVFGHRIAAFGDYLNHDLFRLYKPHGSITWAYELPWAQAVHNLFHDERRYDEDRNKIVASDPTLDDDLTLVWRRPTDAPLAEVRHDPYLGRGSSVAYMPALAIPVEKKPGLILPGEHEAAMRRDLNHASAVLAIGWRAREQHIIDLLADELPQRRQLHVVAETEDAARETAGNLWRTGNFNRHAWHTRGFAHFARSAPSTLPDQPERRAEAVHSLAPVLRQQVPMSTKHPLVPDSVQEYDPDTELGTYAPFEVPTVLDA
ncbi:hypothetical protein [Kineococcus aurantiacus]|uniref:SIR2-like domain-containing protein n=1 Tax=Kineococcus aurantiacus TaxID=37633 RepID=A0A7Y9DQS7_9ACTN|nr:hypothetical protein [Kineococcus aurantiacus]NYD25022.1 hypothetical protein [Kineococcus aurantiacus]